MLQVLFPLQSDPVRQPGTLSQPRSVLLRLSWKRHETFPESSSLFRVATAEELRPSEQTIIARHTLQGLLGLAGDLGLRGTAGESEKGVLGFDRLHVFQHSQWPGANAAEEPDDCEAVCSTRRSSRLRASKETAVPSAVFMAGRACSPILPTIAWPVSRTLNSSALRLSKSAAISFSGIDRHRLEFLAEQGDGLFRERPSCTWL